MKINLINIDNNNTIASFDTKKRTGKAIQLACVEQLEKLKLNPWLQGSLCFDSTNILPLQKGSRLWWLTTQGKVQYEVKQ